ncbi:amino acid permease [Streptomyces pluripotens]|uniref:Amino acid permease n=1 Tax=Streptomyces pluripotens TaxID=1355015 RepID=A0A221P4M2_9ACTN|nr:MULTISPECIES: APC family permease [Streptomyces]ARP72824.1 amino acid transporter [Streptomyces pluripotens]ASN27074.1 amino acid permease [Streptomyces pluripotens]MCH0561285.1 amino acid permease [Streptomyces sp. MUM 16J]
MQRRRETGLGVPALVSIGIGGMVGGGIFSVLGLTVQVAGAGAYISFLVGGTVAALTGVSYAVLSVRIRSRGGTAAFLDRAFGPRLAGPLNLLLWLSYFVMLGLYAIAFGAYLAALLGLSADWRRVLASAVVVCFTALNLAGAKVVGRAEELLVYFKLVVLMLFCIGGLAFVDTSRVAPSAYPHGGAIVYAGCLIFLAYEGFELIANAAEDAAQPERSLPRAYLISIGTVIALYVLVAFVAVGNLTGQQIAQNRDYALAVAARPLLGQAGFTLIAIAAVVSTASAINATLYGTAKFTYLMARHGELPEHLAEPVWNRPIGGLLATAGGTLLIVNLVDIEGISLMGSAGFLLVFAAVNLAAARLADAGTGTRAAAAIGVAACVICLVALIVYAATNIPRQLMVLGAMLVLAVLGEIVIQARGRKLPEGARAASPGA